MIIRVGDNFISENHPVYIIAEAGINHNGSFETAIKMIEVAKNSGADAVKFQIYCSDEMVSDFADLADYQKNINYKKQKDMLKQFELNATQFYELKKYCDNTGITFIATPFDIKSASILNEMNIDIFKISSGDLTNLNLISKIGEFNKPIILSTGMSDLDDIEEALNALSYRNVVLLHCTSVYPAPFDELNLKAISILKNTFDKIVGYSDHSLGLEVPYAIASLGYKILEKHFTLDKSADGPDHKISLEPHEFSAMVKGIRNIEKALGNPVKQITASEKELKALVRKGIYISRDLDTGHLLNSNDLICLRPVNEVEASKYQKVIGKKLNTSKKKGQPLFWQDLL